MHVDSSHEGGSSSLLVLAFASRHGHGDGCYWAQPAGEQVGDVVYTSDVDDLEKLLRHSPGSHGRGLRFRRLCDGAPPRSTGLYAS
jgi:hypothetical protein